MSGLPSSDRMKENGKAYFSSFKYYKNVTFIPDILYGAN